LMWFSIWIDCVELFHFSYNFNACFIFKKLILMSGQRKQAIVFYWKWAKRDLNLEIFHIWNVCTVFIFHLILMHFFFFELITTRPSGSIPEDFLYQLPIYYSKCESGNSKSIFYGWPKQRSFFLILFQTV